MNSCGVRQNAFSNHEEMMRTSVVVCPKPRRLGVINHHLARSLRWQVSHQIELYDSNSGSEILDYILAKGGNGGCGEDQTKTLTSSPPVFFSGSPPSRVSNPLTKDSLFKDELLVLALPPPASPRNGGGGGCVRSTNFGSNPAVRVVGFNCLDRDRRSIPTVA